MKLRYDTGEPVLLGDRVLLKNDRRYVLACYVKPGTFLWETQNLKHFGLLFVNEAKFEELVFDVIPGECEQEASTLEFFKFKRTWSEVKFIERGVPRYSNSNDIVKVGDVIALEESFGFMSLHQISGIVFGPRKAGELIAKDGTSISNTGVFITDKIFGVQNYSTLEILDAEGYMSAEWEHAYFVRRGTLAYSPPPVNTPARELWETLLRKLDQL